MTDTRHRILSEAMRLFGEQGYAATSVAQIESAAGLRPGSGGLYRHFRSKRELLDAGVRERIEDRGELLQSMAPPVGAPAEAVLHRVARDGLRRLDDERDLNRMLVRDLGESPELLEFFRDAELRTNHRALVALLVALGAKEAEGVDVEALAAILIDSISHYWLLRDVFGGEHPLGLSEERYLAALTGLAAAAVGGVEGHTE